METVDKVHIKEWGTFITTSKITNEKAEVAVLNTVVNKNEDSKTIELHFAILDGAGNQVSEAGKSIELNAGETKDIEQVLEVLTLNFGILTRLIYM